MGDIAITVEHVTKSFKIYKEKSQSAKERLIRAGRNPHEVFKALDDVSFDVQQGETFALLGHNGSGKSTLLKCVAGTLRPSSGRIVARGRLAALLELGAGFHPDLTGRENIYLNGSILGFSRIQIDRIFDDIVAFAELEEFIDNQVKHYSSGMYARLGFAVAINVEPEVLLVDEVLAVGDEAFQRKCIERVKKLQADGRTILLVSHAADLVRQLADRAAVLDHGRLVEVAEPAEAIRVLRETLERRGIAAPDLEAEPPTPAEPGPVLAAGGHRMVGAATEAGSRGTSGDKVVEITKVACEYPTTSARYLEPNEPLRIRVDYVAPNRIPDVAFTLEVRDRGENIVYATDTEMLQQPIVTVNGVGAVCFDLPRVPLLDGQFSVSVTVTNRAGGQVFDRLDDGAGFEVVQSEPHRGYLALEPTIVHFFHGTGF
jgi:ABC-2 type transport system ATP-binding protein